jgi:hypothetical protein
MKALRGGSGCSLLFTMAIPRKGVEVRCEVDAARRICRLGRAKRRIATEVEEEERREKT